MTHVEEQTCTGKGQSHARHSTGPQLSSEKLAGLPQTGQLWAEQDTSRGRRQACTGRQQSCCGGDAGAEQQSGQQDLLGGHAALSEDLSKHQDHDLETAPSWLSCACRSGPIVTQEKGGREKGETPNFGLWQRRLLSPSSLFSVQLQVF